MTDTTTGPYRAESGTIYLGHEAVNPTAIPHHGLARWVARLGNDAFRAGAASRQGEVDALREVLGRLVNDYEHCAPDASGFTDSWRTELIGRARAALSAATDPGRVNAQRRGTPTAPDPFNPTGQGLGEPRRPYRSHPRG